MEHADKDAPTSDLQASPPWFGRLPPDWRVIPLRYLVTFFSGGTPDKGNRDYWNGDIPWVSPKDMKRDMINDAEDHITEAAVEESAVQILPAGSVLVVVRGMILAHTLPVAVTTATVTVNQDIKALRCGPSLLPRFLQAVLQGQAHWLLSQTDQSAHGTRKLETELLKQFEVPCPLFAIQQRIIDHLERETARIDNLLAAKQRLLDLLAEKRKAIVAQAVTRGLDRTVPLRDSGVPWLRAVPIHWEIWKIVHIASVGNGSTPNRDEPAYWSGSTIPWLNSAVVNQDEVHTSDQFVTPLAMRECHLPIVRAGSVLIALTGQGKTRGRAVVLSLDATISQHLAFITPDSERLDVWFLRWVLYAAHDFLRAISDDAGGTKGALTCEEVAALRVPVPPFSEQMAIVHYITREIMKLDKVRTVTKRTIFLLKERRAALIAAAVMGKIGFGDVI